MGKSSPPKVHRYSMHFKATAVRLSELPDVLIKDVAEALDIHPFMLSRWRKQAREGLELKGSASHYFLVNRRGACIHASSLSLHSRWAAQKRAAP